MPRKRKLTAQAFFSISFSLFSLSLSYLCINFSSHFLCLLSFASISFPILQSFPSIFPIHLQLPLSLSLSLTFVCPSFLSLSRFTLCPWLRINSLSLSLSNTDLFLFYYLSLHLSFTVFLSLSFEDISPSQTSTFYNFVNISDSLSFPLSHFLTLPHLHETNFRLFEKVDIEHLHRDATASTNRRKSVCVCVQAWVRERVWERVKVRE